MTFQIKMLLNRLDGLAVNEGDKQEWFDNPCMAVFMKLCLSCLSDSIETMMEAKNMNDVVEARGAYRMCISVLNELSRIPSASSGGLDKEQARDIKCQIKELIDEARGRDGRDAD